MCPRLRSNREYALPFGVKCRGCTAPRAPEHGRSRMLLSIGGFSHNFDCRVGDVGAAEQRCDRACNSLWLCGSVFAVGAESGQEPEIAVVFRIHSATRVRSFSGWTLGDQHGLFGQPPEDSGQKPFSLGE